jgi:hypothetical protein
MHDWLPEFAAGVPSKQNVLDLATQISQHTELEKLGDLIIEASATLHSADCEAFFKKLKDAKLSEPSTIAIGLILPIKHTPKDTFQYLLTLTQSYPFLSSPTFHPKWRLAIAMRFAKSALVAGTAEAILGEKGELTALYGKDPALFQIPYLFLSAHVHPVSMEVRLITERDPLILRRNVLSLYYAGMNKLLLDDFEAADQDFLHAWTLSRGAKDMREPIVASLSLSSFLSGKSRSLFESRLPRKYWPQSGPAFQIWDIDRADKLATITGNFQKFQNQLRLERARRIQADLALCVSKVEAGQVGRMLALPEGHPDLKQFQGHGLVPIAREPLDEKIERETALVLKLSGDLGH